MAQSESRLEDVLRRILEELQEIRRAIVKGSR